MLSYQHAYHAGNFADVVKHLTLSRLLSYLVSKDKPLLYLETHAGRGLYDLQSKEAKQTLESIQGIQTLWPQKDKLPSVFSKYLDVISYYNAAQAIHFYPGSPAIGLHCLRPTDRLVCCELHPQEFAALQELKNHGMRIQYAFVDGLKRLTALLPPPERRALVFVDPSYEIKTEYQSIPKVIEAAYHRFSTGVYCIWYPILAMGLHEGLIKKLKAIGAPKWLHLEFYYSKFQTTGMQGSGLWIINPPYVLKAELKEALKALTLVLNKGESSYFLQDEMG